MDAELLFKKASELIINSRTELAHNPNINAYRNFIEGIQILNKIYNIENNENMKLKLKNKISNLVEEAKGYKSKVSKINPESNNNNNDENKEDNDNEFSKMINDTIVSEKPNVKWTDVAGLELAKQSLQEAIILPNKFPEIFQGIRKPWKGILLYGPPGTGKTFLAKACATMANSTFFSVSSSDLISKFVGESEKLIKALFTMARKKKPSIIFIDEVDSMVSSRSDGENEATRRVKTEFLVQMQGVGHDDKGLLVLGATNLPWDLDSAFRRRFEKRIYIPLPDMKARFCLLKNLMKKDENKLSDQDYMVIAKKTEGYSGSDLGQLVKNACFEPLRKLQNCEHFVIIKKNNDTFYELANPNTPGAVKLNKNDFDGTKIIKPKIGYEDFALAFKSSRKTVAEKDLQQYEDWTNEFGVKA